MIQATTSLKKIASLKKRVKVIQGGQGAGKTISILILLINHASSKPNKEILIISAELTKMRLTVIKDFVKVMKLTGLYDDRNFIAGTLYRFPNGSFIKFLGLDKSDVGKGLRSDVAYFNEVNKCDFESYRQVASRAKQVYADYNPDCEFFIHTDVLPDDDVSYLELTFVDNELLDINERNDILRYKAKGYNEDGSIKNEYYANLWRVYGLGQVGALQGVVFESWDKIDSIPKEARLVGRGGDFGYTNDPTTLTDIYTYNGGYIFDEVLYQTDLTNPQIWNTFKSLNLDNTVYTFFDSSEPKSIQELKNLGMRVQGAEKGSDSIMNGIQKMQGINFSVTKRSANLIKELERYKWAADKDGKKLNRPIDNWNHAIDGIRYYFTTKDKYSGKYIAASY